MNVSVIRAIFKRNFVAYFSNPTGYVFICVFVLLSAFATFWPNEFFNSNLASLDQFNRFFPLIMLVFIPAITMSIWAEERRQGTDELLLTIPAGDFDVVAGKYLAAVAIYTVALAFSLSNLLVLVMLGVPDWGLIVSNYVGYWLVGLAMLAIGMVASFLTGNLTVGFILGLALNAPLVFAASADVILPASWALVVRQWSLAERFRDFGRGVISLSSVAYFLLIVAVALYVSMVLIGRRHWVGGRDGRSMLGHYVARGLALVAVAVAVTSVLHYRDRRIDVSIGRLSSLSQQSTQLLGALDAQRPVFVDAYVSPSVPEAYVQTRLNLLSILRSFESAGRGKVVVRVHNVERFSEEAARAQQLHNIQPREVRSRVRGAVSQQEIFLGAAFHSGLNNVVVPFFDRGVPVEYEIIRSIATVSQQDKKKIGILTTDVQLFGGFDMQRMSPSRNELIVDELEKQYEVVQVSPDSPIVEEYDALVVAQPSSLAQEQLNNLLDAIRRGQPVALFEDPFPYLDAGVPATSQPRRPQGGGMMGMQQPPIPKGDVRLLWDLLGVQFNDSEIVWQDYNPYPKIRNLPFVTPEWVFVDDGQGGELPPFNPRDPISAGLQQLLFLFPGSIARRNAATTDVEVLVRTGMQSGLVAYNDILTPSMFGMQQQLNPDLPFRRRSLPQQYQLAVRVSGKPADDVMAMLGQEAAADVLTADAPAAGGTAGDTAAGGAAHGSGETAGELNVVLVADIDLLYSAFFELRTRGDDPEAEANLRVDNVTFVLNIIDSLAGDDRFIEIRKRRPTFRTLTGFEERKERAERNATEQRQQFVEEFDKARNEEQRKLDEMIREIQQREGIDRSTMIREVELAQEVGNRRLEAATDRLLKRRNRQIDQVERELQTEIRRLQDRSKWLSILFPPLLPMALGVAVYFARRSGEREGVSRARLR